MPNEVLMARLESLRIGMIQKFEAGAHLSSVSQGTEREIFKETLLSMVVAPPFRVGTGEIIDSQNRQSGPVDLVIEQSNALSFPMQEGAPRLYVAEGIALALEVKSDLAKQWDKAVDEARKIAQLKRRLASSISFGAGPSETIPVIVSGYEGWVKESTYTEKLAEPSVHGILSIDPGFYVTRSLCARGPASLLFFFADVQSFMSGVLSSAPDYIAYVR